MDDILDLNLDEFDGTQNSHSDRQYFKLSHILVGTFLGGPLAGIYFFAINFKQLKEENRYKLTLLFGIIFTLLLFVAIVVVPILSDIPNIVFTMAYTLIAYSIYNSYQKFSIEESIIKGAKYFPTSHTVIATIIAVVITFSLIFGLLFIFPIV